MTFLTGLRNGWVTKILHAKSKDITKVILPNQKSIIWWLSMGKCVFLFILLLSVASLAALAFSAHKGLSSAPDQDLPDHVIQEEVSNMPDSLNCDYKQYKENTEEITHNNSSQNAQAEPQNEKKTAKLSGQEEHPLPLIDSLEENSIDAFIQKVGEDFFSIDPVLANALRIAEVDLNSDLFNADQCTGLETLTLELIDGTHKQVIVTTPIPGITFSLQGKLEESPLSVFFLSVTEQQALATLRLPDINTVYTIKYILPAGRETLPASGFDYKSSFSSLMNFC